MALNVNLSNAENHPDEVYTKNVYNFLTQSFMHCNTYDPQDKSATGFADRVSNFYLEQQQ